MESESYKPPSVVIRETVERNLGPDATPAEVSAEIIRVYDWIFG